MTQHTPSAGGRFPPVFISHGSPMTALEPREAGRFMQDLGHALDEQFGRPRAILSISAHSLAATPTLWTASQHRAIYDFGGFDPRLRSLRYDVAGAPELAEEVIHLARQAGLAMQSRPQGGLDHGAWTPLRYVYPDAEVPVLPLAFNPHASPAQQFALGQVLSPLADQGVLIMGSGSITHNLGLVFGAGGPPPAIDAAELPASATFRNWLLERSAARDWPALLDYRAQAPFAAAMHPSDEHFLPWFIAAGAAGLTDAPQRIHASLTFGSLGMDAYAFGPEAERLAALIRDASAL
ncbi:DODA-type extradiol aromatic ring-opening family dioxygenase [Paucibacter sp. Y2R2-4]|uniref:DODA-type extradiol aromatic ring-opening family dioxygenase n=1 Tax=Paucibacter sp. Y2R2-4 TaxID=2893553 RepID=UPI0021E3C68C|nr:class III extradiol ring-cleavage dioxygenase [Paucibacter sp. Y2R2-4]MCV2349116.1 dioxygenase [Paucibacter sp. Y2R2-4]